MIAFILRAFSAPAPLKSAAQVRAEQEAFHARLLTPLEDAVLESHIALRDLKASQPKLFPDFHARCGDAQVAA